MKKLYFLFVLFTFFISSCSAKIENEEVITPEATNTAETTPTPTKIPLTDIDLEGILIMNGDLPAGYTGAQIRDNAPEMFNNLPEAQNTIYQQFAKDGETAGGVTVLLFESQEDIENAYKKIIAGFSDAEELDEIGENANITYVDMEVLGSRMQFGDLVFIRCNALAHIRMTDLPQKESLISYAKRLDKRLDGMICK